MSKLTEQLLINMMRYEEKIALETNTVCISYGQLHEHIKSIVTFFKNHDVKQGDKIAIILPNSIEFIEIMIAAAFINCVVVPLQTSLSFDAVKTAFKASDIRHVVGNKFFWENTVGENILDNIYLKVGVGTNNSNIISYERCISEVGNMLSPNSKDCSPFIFTLTSGSTGTPKPIVLTQENKYKRSQSTWRLYGLSNKDVILAATPFYHSLAERLIILPLLLGATGVFMTKFSPREWIKFVEKYRVTFTIAVSSQLFRINEVLSNTDDIDLTSLKCVVSSSSLLDNRCKRNLIDKLECDFHEIYGTSEIAVATDIDFKRSHEKVHSVGCAIPEADVKIMGDDNSILPCGKIGEIVCNTSLIFDGYYNLPDLTKDCIYDGYFKTGDLGYMDEDGFLYFSGRKKEVIITGGINVFPGDVEDVIKQIKGIKECAAFSYPDDNLGEVVAVAVVVDGDIIFDERQVKFICNKKLADYQQPRKYFVVDKLPQNSMGKLVRNELKSQFI